MQRVQRVDCHLAANTLKNTSMHRKTLGVATKTKATQDTLRSSGCHCVTTTRSSRNVPSPTFLLSHNMRGSFATSLRSRHTLAASCALSQTALKLNYCPKLPAPCNLRTSCELVSYCCCRCCWSEPQQSCTRTGGCVFIAKA